MGVFLGACAAERDTDPGTETTAATAETEAEDPAKARADSHSLDIGKLGDWLRSACLREASSLRPVDTLSPELMCEAMFEGLVDSAAEMGRRVEGSEYCVAQGFDTSAYKDRVVRALQVGVMKGHTFTEFALGRLKADDKEKGDCNWTTQRTLGDLTNKCRWFRAFAASDKDAAMRDLARRAGIGSRQEFRRRVIEGFSDCTGYLTGYMAASFFDGDTSAYCADSIEGKDTFKGNNDFMMRKFAALTKDLEDVLHSQSDRSDEPASRHLYPLMADAFPCGG